ncbi:MAG TPA: condensation domain-containing protein, partial [Anaeromyxobacteraceae bacterium]
MSTQETKADIVGFRLSPQQDRLLGGGDFAAVQCAVVLAGPVREAALRAALEEVVARHEILRTTFKQTVGMRDRQQVIHDTLAPGWSSEDADPPGDRDSLLALLGREAELGLDLEHGPLLRAHLVSGAERGLLVLTAHASCADGPSLLQILGQTAQAYSRHGQAPEPIQYADYAEWRHELTAGEEPEAADGRSFWSAAADTDAGAPRLLFSRPTDVPSSRLVPAPLVLGPDELDRLARGAEAAGAGLSVFLEAAWHALIGRISGTGEVLVAGWLDGRGQPDLRQAVGPYAQPAPILTRFDQDTTFAEVLDQVRRARAEAQRWQDYGSGEDLVALAGRTRIAFVSTDVPMVSDPVLEIVALTPPPGAQL